MDFIIASLEKSCCFMDVHVCCMNGTSSCVGESSCQEAAYYGVINSISSSCNAVNSCKGAGSNEGYVEFITDSCNAPNACGK